MSNAIAAPENAGPPAQQQKPPPPALAGEIVEKALLKGDFSKLGSAQRIDFVRNLCESLGLNWLTRPFDFFTDKKSGAVTLYARKDCTEQLRRLHNVTLDICEMREMFGDLLAVTVEAAVTLPSKAKRTDKDVGVVCLSEKGRKLEGEDKANAVMKAVTKAKRRVTLSICGLGGIPDEAELEDVARAQLPAAVEVREAQAVAPKDVGRAPAALLAPAPEPPAPRPTPGQLAEVKQLKDALALSGPAWQAFLAPFGGLKPTEMTPEGCGKLLDALRSESERRRGEELLAAAASFPAVAGAGDGPIPF